MNKVIEQNIVNKMEGKPENELANDATIRFELDDCEYTINVNEENKLEIYKRAKNIKQTDIIKIEARSPNIINLS